MIGSVVGGVVVSVVGSVVNISECNEVKLFKRNNHLSHHLMRI